MFRKLFKSASTRTDSPKDESSTENQPHKREPIQGDSYSLMCGWLTQHSETKSPVKRYFQLDSGTHQLVSYSDARTSDKKYVQSIELDGSSLSDHPTSQNSFILHRTTPSSSYRYTFEDSSIDNKQKWMSFISSVHGVNQDSKNKMHFGKAFVKMGSDQNSSLLVSGIGFQVYGADLTGNLNKGQVYSFPIVCSHQVEASSVKVRIYSVETHELVEEANVENVLRNGANILIVTFAVDSIGEFELEMTMSVGGLSNIPISTDSKKLLRVSEKKIFPAS